jgi:hypothetical protein
MEATIKSLATRDDIANVCKEIGNAKTDTIKWTLIFWIGQVAAMLAIVFLFIKK